MYKYLILLSFYFFAICVSPAHAIDTILVNGKIITVDDRFAIVQALAIKDRRIVAAGSNAEVQKLATATTRVIDVKGRTVIPGLIDNHSHWVRAAEHDELRLDGVTSRKQALKLLAERIAFYCLFSGTLSLATVVITLRRRPPHFGSNDVLLALWLSLFAALSFVRAAQELTHVSTAFEALKEKFKKDVEQTALNYLHANRTAVEAEMKATGVSMELMEGMSNG